MDAPTQQFITTSSILTFGGASTAVWVMAITIQRITEKQSVIVPFILSMVVAFAIAFSANLLSGILSWLVTIVNGCLLFCTATGINEAAAGRPAALTRPHGQRPAGWIASWFAG